MIKILAVALVSAPPEATLPTEGVEPLFEYLGCIMEPAGRSFTSIPAARDEREEIVRRILAGCAEVRRRAAALADARAADIPGYTDPELRRGSIASFLDGWDNTVRHMIVDHEKFVEAVKEYEACLDRGETEC